VCVQSWSGCVADRLPIRTSSMRVLTVLGAIEEAAPPAMLAATVLDIGAYARCSILLGGHLYLQVKACTEPCREGEREKPENPSEVDNARLRPSRIGPVAVDADNRQRHSCLCGPVCPADCNGYRPFSSKGRRILASQARGSLSVRIGGVTVR
jgi:hypothetical protein